MSTLATRGVIIERIEALIKKSILKNGLNKDHSVTLDFTELYLDVISTFKIYDDIKKYLEETLKYINAERRNREEIEISTIKVIGYPIDMRLEEVKQVNNIDQIVGIKGFLVSASDVFPLVKEVETQCINCEEVFKTKSNKRIKCESCGKKEIRILNAIMQNTSIALFQEEIKDSSQIIKDIKIYFHDNLINDIKLGTPCRITGILRISYKKPSSVGNVFEYYIEALGIEYVKDDININYRLTQEEKTEIENLVKNNFDVLINSVLPDVTMQEYKIIKEVVLYQMVSSVPNKKQTNNRTWFHVLLCGDSATFKTAILNACFKLHPKCLKGEATMVTDVGLIATVDTKNTETGKRELTLGAAALADDGMLVLDELDKVKRKEDLHALLTPMDSGIAVITKAGVHRTINMRTSFLMACNPKGGVYNPNIPFLANFPFMTHAFLSRVIPFVVRQPRTEDEISQMLDDVENFIKGEKMKESISETLMKKYIIYTSEFNPEFTKDALDTIKYFIKHDMSKQLLEKTESFDPRRGLDIYRLALASAKARLKDKVEVSDAENAIRIYKESLKQIGAYDEKTGKIDHSVFNGYNKEELDSDGEFIMVFNALKEKSEDGTVDMNELITALLMNNNHFKTEDKVRKKIEEKYNLGMIIFASADRLRWAS